MEALTTAVAETTEVGVVAAEDTARTNSADSIEWFFKVCKQKCSTTNWFQSAGIQLISRFPLFLFWISVIENWNHYSGSEVVQIQKLNVIGHTLFFAIRKLHVCNSGGGVENPHTKGRVIVCRVTVARRKSLCSDHKKTQFYRPQRWL